MPTGELALHYVLKNHILQLQYNWLILNKKKKKKKKKKSRPKNQSTRPKLYR